jgi:hypothetical protein
MRALLKAVVAPFVGVALLLTMCFAGTAGAATPHKAVKSTVHAASSGYDCWLPAVYDNLAQVCGQVVGHDEPGETKQWVDDWTGEEDNETGYTQTGFVEVVSVMSGVYTISRQNLSNASYPDHDYWTWIVGHEMPCGNYYLAYYINFGSGDVGYNTPTFAIACD